jgi:lipopolysaccharide biosynthesis regulator YciM
LERKERDIIKIDATKILEEAHEKLEIEYQNERVLKKAIDNANKLSRFFSNIKRYANY